MLRKVIGCMSGTSIDALDVALVEIQDAGLQMIPRFVRGHSRPLADLGPVLRKLADQQPLTTAQMARAAHRLAELHAAAIREVLREERADLICVHGQTIFHDPPLSWQLVTVAPIAAAFNTGVVYDLRAADLAAGGQGAPITPLADYIFFRSDAESCVVLNLGGFCNFTHLPRGGDDDRSAAIGRIAGGDICACNHVLDAVARKALKQPFDEDGRTASSGAVNEKALNDLKAILVRQAGSGRSLGTGDETGAWVDRFLGSVAPADLAATACRAIATTIADRLRDRGAGRVLVAGGSTRNLALTAALSESVGIRVQPTDEFGLPATYREAACMAVLGALCQDGVPITLPQITGCRAPAPRAGSFVRPPFGQ